MLSLNLLLVFQRSPQKYFLNYSTTAGVALIFPQIFPFVFKRFFVVVIKDSCKDLTSLGNLILQATFSDILKKLGKIPKLSFFLSFAVISVGDVRCTN